MKISLQVLAIAITAGLIRTAPICTKYEYWNRLKGCLPCSTVCRDATPLCLYYCPQLIVDTKDPQVKDKKEQNHVQLANSTAKDSNSSLPIAPNTSSIPPKSSLPKTPNGSRDAVVEGGDLSPVPHSEENPSDKDPSVGVQSAEIPHTEVLSAAVSSAGIPPTKIPSAVVPPEGIASTEVPSSEVLSAVVPSVRDQVTGPSTKNSDERDFTVLEIIGIVASVLILPATLLIGLYLCWKRKKHCHRKRIDEPPDDIDLREIRGRGPGREGAVNAQNATLGDVNEQQDLRAAAPIPVDSDEEEVSPLLEDRSEEVSQVDVSARTDADQLQEATARNQPSNEVTCGEITCADGSVSVANKTNTPDGNHVDEEPVDVLPDAKTDDNSDANTAKVSHAKNADTSEANQTDVLDANADDEEQSINVPSLPPDRPRSVNHYDVVESLPSSVSPSDQRSDAEILSLPESQIQTQMENSVTESQMPSSSGAEDAASGITPVDDLDQFVTPVNQEDFPPGTEAIVCLTEYAPIPQDTKNGRSRSTITQADDGVEDTQRETQAKQRVSSNSDTSETKVSFSPAPTTPVYTSDQRSGRAVDTSTQTSPEADEITQEAEQVDHQEHLSVPIQASPSNPNLSELEVVETVGGPLDGAMGAEEGERFGIPATDETNQHHAANERRSIQSYLTDVQNDMEEHGRNAAAVGNLAAGAQLIPAGTRPLPQGVQRYDHPDVSHFFRDIGGVNVRPPMDPETASEESYTSESTDESDDADVGAHIETRCDEQLTESTDDNQTDTATDESGTTEPTGNEAASASFISDEPDSVELEDETGCETSDDVDEEVLEDEWDPVDSTDEPGIEAETEPVQL